MKGKTKKGEEDTEKQAKETVIRGRRRQEKDWEMEGIYSKGVKKRGREATRQIGVLLSVPREASGRRKTGRKNEKKKCKDERKNEKQSKQ